MKGAWLCVRVCVFVQSALGMLPKELHQCLDSAELLNAPHTTEPQSLSVQGLTPELDSVHKMPLFRIFLNWSVSLCCAEVSVPTQGWF